MRRVQRRDVLFIALLLDPWLQLPVGLAEIVLAGGLFLYYWPHRRFALHYLVITLVIVCIGLLPLFGGPPDDRLFLCTNNGCTLTLGFGSHLNLLSQSLVAVLMRFILSYALLAIGGGLCDHLFLRHTIAPVK